MPRRFHVRCRREACGFHVRAVGGLAAEEVKIGHEDRNGHTVDVIAEDVVAFTPASEVADDEVEA